eukprot:m51a1_g4917 hypothetical protein (175) ;mRNA; r:218442-218966
MTWLTPLGERELNVAERRLLGRVLSAMLDNTREDEGSGGGDGGPGRLERGLAPGPFERLPESHKYSALYAAAMALTSASSPRAPLTPTAANAVEYVLAWLREQFAHDTLHAAQAYGRYVSDVVAGDAVACVPAMWALLPEGTWCTERCKWELAVEVARDRVVGRGVELDEGAED